MRVAGKVSSTALPTTSQPKNQTDFHRCNQRYAPNFIVTGLEIKGDLINVNQSLIFLHVSLHMQKIKLWFSNSLLAGRHNLRVELGRVSIQLRNEPMLQTQEFTQSGWFRERVSYLLAQTMPSHLPCHQKDKTLTREEGHLRLKQQTVGTE